MQNQDMIVPQPDEDACNAIILQDIDQPHSHDILLCEGDGATSHVGNAHWRVLVEANLKIYASLGSADYKRLLVHSIIMAIRGQSPPGRFLKKNANTDLWYDVGNLEAHIWTVALFDRIILLEGRRQLEWPLRYETNYYTE